VKWPDGVEWLLHRVATAGVYQDSLATIRSEWTLDDLLDAHRVIDASEEATRRAYAGTSNAGARGETGLQKGRTPQAR
jgi:hypothetical protein